MFLSESLVSHTNPVLPLATVMLITDTMAVVTIMYVVLSAFSFLVLLAHACFTLYATAATALFFLLLLLLFLLLVLVLVLLALV